MELYVLVKLVLLSTGITLIFSEEIFTNRFIFGIDEGKFTHVADLLKEEGFLYKDTFFPGVYVFQRTGEDKHEEEDLDQLQRQLGTQVEVIEQVVDFFTHPDFETETSAVAGEETEATKSPIHHDVQVDYSTYTDMGIIGAWRAGYTGRGVNVAVLDVGVDVRLKDLRENINTNLQWNYINNNHDVSPSVLGVYPETHGLSDHGNRCSGLIAAVKDNGICGDGVAYGSKLVPLKIIDLTVHGYPAISARADVITKGLLANGRTIDIFSSSWGRSSVISEQKSFHMAMQEGVSKGRKGKGSIYVFPAGDIGDPFANDFRTITVNGVGTKGRQESYTEQSSAVLTSAYGQGIASQTHDMPTPSAFHPNCSESFRGLSAATALVAGIIALALETNTELNWRDVQHLIVESSAHETLPQYKDFKPNGANKYYHNHLGFGLLNATQLVTLAKTWTSKRRAEHMQVDFQGPCTKNPLRPWQCIAKHDVHCPPNQRGMCVTSLEHVRVTLSFYTQTLDETEIAVESPNGTSSILLDSGQMKRFRPRSTNDMTFTTVHFWGENPIGTWRVEIIQKNSLAGGDFLLHHARIDIHGEADGETAPSIEESVNITTATTNDTNNSVKQSSFPTVIFVPVVAALAAAAAAAVGIFVFYKVHTRRRRTGREAAVRYHQQGIDREDDLRVLEREDD